MLIYPWVTKSGGGGRGWCLPARGVGVGGLLTRFKLEAPFGGAGGGSGAQGGRCGAPPPPIGGCAHPRTASAAVRAGRCTWATASGTEADRCSGRSQAGRSSSGLSQGEHGVGIGVWRGWVGEWVCGVVLAGLAVWVPCMW